MYCNTNNMHIAASQFITIFLYFDFSCPVEEIIILIPTYTKTDSSPTSAINLNDLYHFHTVFFNSNDVEVFVSPGLLSRCI